MCRFTYVVVFRTSAAAGDSFEAVFPFADHRAQATGLERSSGWRSDSAKQFKTCFSQKVFQKFSNKFFQKDFRSNSRRRRVTPFEVNSWNVRSSWHVWNVRRVQVRRARAAPAVGVLRGVQFDALAQAWGTRARWRRNPKVTVQQAAGRAPAGSLHETPRQAATSASATSKYEQVESLAAERAAVSSPASGLTAEQREAVHAPAASQPRRRKE